MNIERIEYPELQKSIHVDMDAHSVRLDVYVKDDRETVYDTEMQVSDTKELPKRSRYYQGMIDLQLVDAGQHYKKLNKSYIIFICPFDLLKLLNVLLSTETGSQDKCQILEEDFHIRMTQTLESEVSLMCNLSKGVEQKGIEKGRQEGIIAMVSALKDLQIADSIILKKIQEKFHLAEDTAKMYL
ncbi:hypothetical protein IMSAGC011_01017 [Lachnospiraceae bacterium]|nr:hypothetical protein IMSAGC011_01017 [Lachnospiraceae bacterium]